MPVQHGHDDVIPAAWRHLLEVGCWHSTEPGREKLASFLAVGAVLRGNVEPIRGAWREYGALVKQKHRAYVGRASAGQGTRRGAGSVFLLTTDTSQPDASLWAVTFTDTGAVVNGLEIIDEPSRDEASREVATRQRSRTMQLD
jgi:hypothetical protein